VLAINHAWHTSDVVNLDVLLKTTTHQQEQLVKTNLNQVETSKAMAMVFKLKISMYQSIYCITDPYTWWIPLL
jgi:hypothetical protein